MRQLIMDVLTNLIQLIIIFGISFFIHFLQERIGNERLRKFYCMAKIFVKDAEMIYEANEGLDKKKYVSDCLNFKCKGKLKDDEISSLIESAVYDLKVLSKDKNLKNDNKNIIDDVLSHEINKIEKK